MYYSGENCCTASECCTGTTANQETGAPGEDGDPFTLASTGETSDGFDYPAASGLVAAPTSVMLAATVDTMSSPDGPSLDEPAGMISLGAEYDSSASPDNAVKSSAKVAATTIVLEGESSATVMATGETSDGFDYPAASGLVASPTSVMLAATNNTRATV